MIKKILLLGVLLLFAITTYHTALAQSARDCTQHTICAQPGDYIKYSAQVYGNQGTVLYNFGNLLDPNTIKVSIGTLVGNHTINGQSTLNLKNATLINSDGSKGPFFFMVITPVNSNEVAASPFKETTDTYNGYQRTILALESANGTDSEQVKVDKETGVLLDFNVSHMGQINGHDMIAVTSFKLVDTNIINSSNVAIANIVPSSIPQWIKNTARWWSIGAVSDTEFIQSMQYLIQQKILQVPPTTQSSIQQSNSIPQWIKTNAGWWANGQITDDEFIKGIQYLITNGIIKV